LFRCGIKLSLLDFHAICQNPVCAAVSKVHWV
jgi:hypothetical protein